MGILSVDVNDQQAALEAFNDALSLWPDSATFYFWKGNIQSNMNKTLEAIENYDKAINLDPDNSISYFRIGEGLQKL